MLLGRQAECAQLVQLLVDARDGSSSAFLVRGEAGIGKSALLEYAASRAEQWRIIRTAGVESEMELAFAGVHQLCAGEFAGLARLPSPQRTALEIAFGLKNGPPPDRFMVGLAVLTLLSDAADENPVLCLIDDVQWIDQSSVQVLAFVARRLQAESVVMIFAERSTTESALLAGVPHMSLAGLNDAAAHTLLSATVTGPMDERVRERILLETAGNPLALRELAGDASPVVMAGGFGLPSESTVPSRIEGSYRRRVSRLPDPTQLMLVLAAAEPTGEASLLWRAADLLGLPAQALAAAEADGLITAGTLMTFRHSLLRSAVYNDASIDIRRACHRALAQATDPAVDPDRRAWHLAHATTGPDENVAMELEMCADRAHSRGGVAAAAAFLEKAVVLSPLPAVRARRALAAAQAKQAAGAPEAALTLLALAAVGPLDPRQQALVTRLHGMIALDLRNGNDAVPLLLDAARRLGVSDPGLARDTYLEALRAASIAGRLGDGLVDDAARAARDAPIASGAARGVDRLLDALAIRFTDGYPASASALKGAIRTLCDEESSRGDEPPDLRWPWLGRRVAPELFDDVSWHTVAGRNVLNARKAGALSVLPLALNGLASLYVHDGDLRAATLLLQEADTIVAATDAAPMLFGWLLLAGWGGDEPRTAQLVQQTHQAAHDRGEGVLLTFAELARAVLHNGLGQYDDSRKAATSACNQDELMVSIWALPELIEAASRCDRLDEAKKAVERFTECAEAADTNLAHGLAARCQAILATGSAADALYQDSIARLETTRTKTALARTRLLYGEWLRRDGRRAAAREHLRTSYDMFAAMGAAGFAERARRELLATGETVRKRDLNEPQALTPQEAQIAQLAVSGRTNAEIGAELFISPRTVEWHLRKVFAKLTITSRRQLRDALGKPVRATQGA